MKLYHLWAQGKNRSVKLTGYPMPHEECRVMKSKFSNQSRIIFIQSK
jgi:hypothetical protein